MWRRDHPRCSEGPDGVSAGSSLVSWTRSVTTRSNPWLPDRRRQREPANEGRRASGNPTSSARPRMRRRPRAAVSVDPVQQATLTRCCSGRRRVTPRWPGEGGSSLHAPCLRPPGRGHRARFPEGDRVTVARQRVLHRGPAPSDLGRVRRGRPARSATGSQFGRSRSAGARSDGCQPATMNRLKPSVMGTSGQ